MKFVVDTKILVSFFRQNPVNKIIINSRLFGISLYTSDYNIEELINNKKDVCKYADLNEKEFIDKISELRDFIKVVEINKARKFKKQAQNLSPHEKDVPVFALAILLDSAIWSNEYDFKNQDKVKVLSTRDMIELLL